MASGVFSIRQQAQAAGHGAWAGSQTTPYVEYLVVAGGGGGGRNGGGGGGGGGLLQGISPIIAGTPLTVTVGGGGSAGSSGSSVNNRGTVGCNSVFGFVAAVGGGGGGGGGGYSGVGSPGGSGGGGASPCLSSPPSGSQGIFGQGNAGGIGGTTTLRGSGGGGGAGTAGLNGINQYGGKGGTGIASTISGTVTPYAGGGGGPGGSCGGAGGIGGGGVGGYASAGVPTAGTANTGGGGGGDWNNVSSVGNGGSGIVIISYPDNYNAPASFGGANSPTASTSGSGSVYFNGSSAIAYSANSLNIRTNSFTFEGWFNFSSTSGTIGLFGSAGANTFYIAYLSGNLYVGDGSTNTIGYPYTISTGTWYSIAVSFDGTSYRLFVNGSLLINSTTLLANTTLTNLSVANYNSTNYFTGYVSNARYVKGTAVYTSTYTVSTIPLTAITNTSLLLNTVSGAYLADGSTNSFAVTATGSPTWNQASPFATGLGYKNRVYTWTGSGTVTF